MFTDPNTPNLADFLDFLATSVQIPTTALPAESPFPGYALQAAIALVINPPAACVPGYPGVLYALACYNGATHILFTIAPDQPGQNYFANARGNNANSVPPGFGLNTLPTGIVTSAADQGTSTTLTAPQWAAGLTLDQLGYLRTPWGREFLAWNQKFGPTIIGIT